MLFKIRVRIFETREAMEMETLVKDFGLFDEMIHWWNWIKLEEQKIMKKKNNYFINV